MLEHPILLSDQRALCDCHASSIAQIDVFVSLIYSRTLYYPHANAAPAPAVRRSGVSAEAYVWTKKNGAAVGYPTAWTFHGMMMYDGLNPRMPFREMIKL